MSSDFDIVLAIYPLAWQGSPLRETGTKLPLKWRNNEWLVLTSR